MIGNYNLKTASITTSNSTRFIFTLSSSLSAFFPCLIFLPIPIQLKLNIHLYTISPPHIYLTIYNLEKKKIVQACFSQPSPIPATGASFFRIMKNISPPPRKIKILSVLEYATLKSPKANIPVRKFPPFFPNI